MILLWLILVPVLGALLAACLGSRPSPWPRRIALVSTTGLLALTLWLWTAGGPWRIEFDREWIPALGIRFHLALDGLSLLMLLLTAFLGLLSVASSWTAIRERVGFYYLNLLLVLAGIAGVFLAVDLFLFYVFWELMLVPMYFLIALWGHENRHAASIKFFLFTQLSGLLMLAAILGLYFVHGRNTGDYTFDYSRLLGTVMAPATALWLLLGFLAAFLVKLPAVPLHTWLPDAHSEAPTAGSVILAGLLLKTGAYGLLRFAVPLFPGAAVQFAPVGMVLGAIGILYGAALAFAQTDFKRLVAYTSVSHLGFVLLGVFAWNTAALQGAVMQMVCHGLSTGALFMLAGALDERLHTRDMRRMGGLWGVVPRMGAAALFFALASLGLPGLGNFVAEFLVLLGAFQASVTLAVLAAVGLVAATVYALWLIQQTFHGPALEHVRIADLTGRELVSLLALVAALVWLGLYPQPVLDLAAPSIAALQRRPGQVAPLPQTGQRLTPNTQHPTPNATLRSGEAPSLRSTSAQRPPACNAMRSASRSIAGRSKTNRDDFGFCPDLRRVGMGFGRESRWDGTTSLTGLRIEEIGKSKIGNLKSKIDAPPGGAP